MPQTILQQLDSNTRTPRFYNASVDVDPAGSIMITGNYDAADLIPVILFSIGVPWTHPACVTHVCCLWDLANHYKDHALTQQLGPTCNEEVNLTSKDLMQGNQPRKSVGSWGVKTMVHPTFVIMLFLCTSPFFIFYETVPIQWPSSAITWRSAWYGNKCHEVVYTDGKTICIYCVNQKPENSAYIFNTDWLQTFQCSWTCNSGYAGPNCEINIQTTLSLGGSAVGLVCVGWLYLLVRNGGARFNKKTPSTMVEIDQAHHGPPKLPSSLPLPHMSSSTKSEIITFKDNVLSDIRIKLL